MQNYKNNFGWGFVKKMLFDDEEMTQTYILLKLSVIIRIQVSWNLPEIWRLP